MSKSPLIAPSLTKPIAVGATSAIANYEAHTVDELQKAVENIKVTGYRILIALPKMKEKSSGGIIIDQQLLDREKLAANIGYVCKIGPDAYNDKKKFPNGPYCAEGDWVVFKSYSGTRIKSILADIELRIMYDDSVEAVIDDVTKYTRI